MPKEETKAKFPPSKFYLDQDFLEEVVCYDLIECLKQFARDSGQGDFIGVYSDFNFPVVLEFARWRSAGMSSIEKELAELSHWYYTDFDDG